MYIPKAFQEQSLEVLHGLIRNYNFATLVSSAEGMAHASHLPFLLDPEGGPRGTLVTHMARANKQWRGFTDGREVMVIFQGPHCYISPSWYRNKVTVPTWNYAVAHIYGRPTLIEDPAKLRDMMARLVAQHESNNPRPWSIETAAPIMEKQLQGIVAFEIPILRIEGKFKFNQNLPIADREGVIEALQSSRSPGERDVAKIMKSHLD